ncbi:hypothetical protein [Phytomonospora endophytica]|uniref:Uncharacterized protein n=1 Tax=Phytomonospora endophytica TaxID=714109 RepID=A0A841FQW5_9ACTN|nr:hypothetical protein [Phytomonospora endophytica]MBB6038224.1 hypothetical protein [Phytomonospora endophytica]GIG67317.1 hypothetical protein Pen01_36120 [Phytomonospora endophytica]
MSLNRYNPVAKVARALCRRRCGTNAASVGMIGRVACGAHWEQAIRNDERVAVEHDLPPAPQDPDLIDDIAVEAAMTGKPVSLTRAEQREAARRLQADGLSLNVIAMRLRLSHAVLTAILASADGTDRDVSVLATANAFHAECAASTLAAVA